MTLNSYNAESNPLLHSAFYRFVELTDIDEVARWLRKLSLNVLGSILVAPEGINGVLAGPADDLDVFERALQCDGRFAGIVFKRSHCTTPPFARMKVHCKSEIVSIGVPVDVLVDAPVDTADVADVVHRPVGTRVSPQAWRELMAQDDVVVLDNRNAFEFRLGRFKSALNPNVENFRDFPNFVRAQAPAWKASGQRVAMYCTGGIRCEKTSAWMHSLGLDVYELDGGILNYFQALPDAQREWEGECFVFDNRIALNTQLQETATTAEDVYADSPDDAWRLMRARRLDAAG